MVEIEYGAFPPLKTPSESSIASNLISTKLYNFP